MERLSVITAVTNKQPFYIIFFYHYCIVTGGFFLTQVQETEWYPCFHNYTILIVTNRTNTMSVSVFIYWINKVSLYIYACCQLQQDYIDVVSKITLTLNYNEKMKIYIQYYCYYVSRITWYKLKQNKKNWLAGEQDMFLLFLEIFCLYLVHSFTNFSADFVNSVVAATSLRLLACGNAGCQ